MIGGADPYRWEGEVALIEVRIARIEQLFAAFDPAPFHQRDLDPAVDEYVVEAARDLPQGAPLKLVVHAPASGFEPLAPAEVEPAVQAYFRYRVWTEERRLRHLLRQGGVSLLIGGSFLMACVGLRRLVSAMSTGTLAEIVAEGLLISGWVAMWRPIQIFLYDWWPIRRSARRYETLARMPVECRVIGPAGPPATTVLPRPAD